MAYNQEDLREIYRKTDGRCHLCWKGLRFSSYGQDGGWEVEHSNPRSNGGTDRFHNLFPAHIRCNRQKGTITTRTVRAWHGQTRAPLSKAKKEEIRSKNRWGWAAGLGLFGIPAGLPAVLFLGLIGAAIGDSINPEG